MTGPGEHGAPRHGAGTSESVPVPDDTPSAVAAPPETGGPASPGDTPSVPTRRFWSARRGPAAFVAVLLLAGTAAVLYDLGTARAEMPPPPWRTALVEDLAVRRLDDPWVLTAAAVVLLVGLWLLVLAVTPGLRGVLPVRRSGVLSRPGLERGAASLVLRDRALEVSGVRTARVAVGRHTVRVTAQVHFREVATVQGELEAVLQRTLDDLGLARRPTLSVRARRPGRG